MQNININYTMEPMVLVGNKRKKPKYKRPQRDGQQAKRYYIFGRPKPKLHSPHAEAISIHH